MTKWQEAENILITAMDLLTTASDAVAAQGDCNHIVGTLLLAGQYLENFLEKCSNFEISEK